MSDPQAPRSPEQSLDAAPGATVRIQAGDMDDAQGTQRMERTDPGLGAGTQKMSMTPGARDQAPKLAPPPEPRWGEGAGASAPEPSTHSSAPVSQRRGWLMPALLGGVVVVGAAAYLVYASRSVIQVPEAAARGAAPEAVPEAAKHYHDQAQAGDAHAMRMLGVMYYYGLNIPQDREKGLFWYRKAAEKGSDAARDELRKLESGS